MGSTQENILRVLQRNGTDQSSRKGQLPDPEAVQLHGFALKEWMQFAYAFASKVNFFGKENDQIPSGNWEGFFKNDEQLEQLLAELEADQRLTPHLTLFICFLRLMELPKKSFNNLTKRHLDFYYEKVLRLEYQPAQADRVHLLFELAKNTAVPFLIESGTETDGGKDGNGKPLIYATEKDLSVYTTEIAQLKNVYNPPHLTDNDGNVIQQNHVIKSAAVANSADGLGAELKADTPSWFPFGYYDPQGLLGLTELPDAKLGFAISSKLLSLSEGERTVKTTLNFNRGLNEVLQNEEAIVALTIQDILSNLTVFATGEKGWLQCEFDTAASSISGDSLLLVNTIKIEEKAIVNYNAAVHGEQFDTEFPILRFLINANSEVGYRIYERLTDSRWNLQSVDLGVSVTGIKTVTLSNDSSDINAKKPFFPFTPQPKKGSSFSVYYEEAFSKPWRNITIDFDWKNTPLKFKDWYDAYSTGLSMNGSKSKYANRFYIVNPKQGKQTTPDDAIVTGDSYFTVTPSLFSKEDWVGLGANRTLFQGSNGDFHFEFSTTSNPDSTVPSGPIKFTTNQSFLHELYPQLYALAFMNIASDPNTIIPNEPYTPFAENLQLSYDADETLDLSASVTDTTAVLETRFSERTFQLFHEHPFGQSEEHPYLQSVSSGAVVVNGSFALPEYTKGGEFYLGFESAEVLQQVNLLIQVNEGSENPLSPAYATGEKIQWDMLCSNFWKPLESPYMMADEIDNFLKSGIVTFTIPQTASNNNTLLPTGLFWLRAKTDKPFDSVCKVLGIHAQAVTAAFKDNANELSHLESGLANGTISKLIQRLGQVKSIKQPYNSFGGKPKETDVQFYQRVSERLRHKNRAITLWDYEHLVLQEFPSIYKVKCLNHTCSDSYNCGGNVTLIVVPNTSNKNMFDNYRPRVSKATLNSVKRYLDNLISLHVKLNVINPDYEEVRVEVSVKFNEGYDNNLYTQQLNEDITRFLSPWAFDTEAPITFGITLHRNRMIQFIEQLEYIDYVDEIKLFQNEEFKKTSCEPSTPKSILVSVRQHTITVATKVCTSSNTISEECQA